MNEDLILEEEYYTRCFFPKFEASFNGDIKEVLMNNFGIEKLFVPYVHDCFSKIMPECEVIEAVEEEPFWVL